MQLDDWVQCSHRMSVLWPLWMVDSPPPPMPFTSQEASCAANSSQLVWPVLFWWSLPQTTSERMERTRQNEKIFPPGSQFRLHTRLEPTKKQKLPASWRNSLGHLQHNRKAAAASCAGASVCVCGLWSSGRVGSGWHTTSCHGDKQQDALEAWGRRVKCGNQISRLDRAFLA